MPNAFVSNQGSVIPFDRVIAIRASLDGHGLSIYISANDKFEFIFKSKADLEAQRDAFLAYLTPTTTLI